MAHIKGNPVTIYIKTQTGTDPFNRPIYTEVPETVNNVIISPASSDDISTTLDLTGKKAVYTLGIPKGDEHDWEDKKVGFFGKTWRTIAFTIEGIEENIPLEWHRKIQVERYE